MAEKAQQKPWYARHIATYITYAHLSDEEMANKARMLMRGDLGHEGVCVGARDRIALVCSQRDELLAALQALYDACELRANKEGGDFGGDIGPAAEQARAAIVKARPSDTNTETST